MMSLGSMTEASAQDRSPGMKTIPNPRRRRERQNDVTLCGHENGPSGAILSACMFHAGKKF
jgi:hypothetical protein